MFTIKEISVPCTLYNKKATLYMPASADPRACVLYFHGGGLLFGSRRDLPEGHIRAFTDAGYAIASFDYPLAPSSKLPEIFPDICSSIDFYANNSGAFCCDSLPYFLWGRSAGAAMCLLAAGKGHAHPAGILSYYGYGFLCDNWFRVPDPYYTSLPAVDASCLRSIPEGITTEGDISTRYSVYVYARQTGAFLSLIYDGREKYFYTDYTLRLCGSLPCPVFAAHCTGDTDVPYDEFHELCSRFHAEPFIVSGHCHDFDRDPHSPSTAKALSASVSFLDRCLARSLTR